MPPRPTPLLRRLRPQFQAQVRHQIPRIAISSNRQASLSTSSSSSLNSNPDPTFTTVSPDEVSHFNALASSWWDPQGPSRILHLMNPLRHDFIRDCRFSVPVSPVSTTAGLTYLDIGCGGGIFAESAARLRSTKSVTAIDPSPEVLTIAKAHARRDPALRGKLEYLNTPVEQLPAPAPQEGYDVVSIFEVLEHVSNPAQFLDRCMPFVKPGGWLVMSTIARTWMSWFTTNLMAEDVLGIVPKGTHDWRKYVNEDELRGHFLGKRDGWGEARCMGVIYVPGIGWREVRGSEKVGNYFFAVRRLEN
ncbi:S-adenosyl-L-methionine-dependent methyltransferase [Pseudomassariella vexata]|uniref:Ubiquinone biosynthesis O-methyltransferase, mitochondrial n=1 Tax=Pseudomassariella vexata TaxID=1141098 RepID=A0A1Y2DTD1_9PEZI|nr:S-adenosyl-L-methionine-dependent methyltransferase [Pseudomassariella vexata]ORY62533.1 S-adenosyl-L-methionine-dependent methyltransferase [Pseudomassariella vexata]